MNKKFLLALALPAVMVGCSQEDLVNEGVVAKAPEGKAIDNVTFTIAKDAADLEGVDSRAAWVNNKIKFEKSDKVSLYWLGADGYTAHASNGTFSNTGAEVDNAANLYGKSNAVFRTEDGSSFTAEAVVYEGYNLLVYPANVKHTTNEKIVVGLPATQKAADNFAENAIYVGDSILHIHQPAYNESKEKYYDIYGNVATTEDANTSGYAHGVKTGVKLLTSLLNMDLRIVNAPANNVVINKVVLTTTTELADAFNKNVNIKANGDVTNPIGYVARSGSKAKYINPWIAKTAVADDQAKSVVLDFAGVTTNVSGSTKGTMLLLPSNITDLVTNQPVLKVYTNYGVVTIGGNVAANDAQTNAIYKKDGIEKAASTDNEALQDIVDNATNYKAKLDVYDSAESDKKQDYTFNSGVSMTRVIKVDMAKAEMVGMTASTTEELNAILNAAIANPNNKFSGSNKLQVALIPNKKGEFTLSNYTGLDAFVDKFKAGALELTKGENPSNNRTLATVVMETTAATELKNVEGLESTVTLTIPATSKINAIKNGAKASQQHVVNNAIVNKTTFTIPAHATITLADNAKGKVIYTKDATMDLTALNEDTYGIIYYEAATKGAFDQAVTDGVNYVKINGLSTTFFSEGIEIKGHNTVTGTTVEFSNCGKLNETVEGDIETETIVLSNGTSYPNLTKADVNKIIVKTATAELGYPTAGNATAKTIPTVEIAEGTTTIKYLDIETLTIMEGATADMDKKTAAPTNFYVFGTAKFTGSNKQTDEKVYVDANYNGKIDGINAISGQCIVTGSLNLANDLAYEKVAVCEHTNITVAEGVMGLGYTTKIFVTKDTQAKGTNNLKFTEDSYSSSKISWNHDVEDINW